MHYGAAMANINDTNETYYGSNGSSGSKSASDTKQTFEFAKEKAMEEYPEAANKIQGLMQSKLFWGVTIGVIGAIGGGVAYYLASRRKPTLAERVLEAFEVIGDQYPKYSKKAAKLFR